MNATAESSAFDRAVEPVLRQVVPHERAHGVVEFKVDDDLKARIDELASKSTEGELTEDERLEYQGYIRANKFIATLRRQVQRIVTPLPPTP